MRPGVSRRLLTGGVSIGCVHGLEGNPSVKLDVLLVGLVTTISVATIGVPSWVQDQSKTMPVGQAADFVVVGVVKTLLTVLEVAGLDTSAKLPANSTWSIWGSVADSNFVELGYSRNNEGPYTMPATVRIVDGYNPPRAIKRGRAEESDLMEFIHISSMDRISPLNDQRCAIMIDMVKNKVALTERVVYCSTSALLSRKNLKAPHSRRIH